MNLLTVCIQAAKAAGTYVLSHKPRRDEVDEHFAHDVKLKLDRESQLVAEKAIHTLFPQSIILGEEGSKSGEDGLEWVIDPIDGTVNFFHGIPWWCSSVAVRVNGEVMAGAVYAPEMNMLYSAELNGPAYLNDQAIQPSKITTMGKALVITGSEKEINPDDPPLATAQKLAPHVQKIRILGAAALDICQIANGAA
ncbi:MAG TPA: inositol monophosphatase family protein, partial [Kiritimatiellia bacterium]|nr:inositol monophosphatase family protein [Kiritimatiellia bacterium]